MDQKSVSLGSRSYLCVCGSCRSKLVVADRNAEHCTVWSSPADVVLSKILWYAKLCTSCLDPSPGTGEASSIPLVL